MGGVSQGWRTSSIVTKKNIFVTYFGAITKSFSKFYFTPITLFFRSNTATERTTYATPLDKEVIRSQGFPSGFAYWGGVSPYPPWGYMASYFLIASKAERTPSLGCAFHCRILKIPSF